MTKKILKIISILVLCLSFFSNVFAYNITEKDEDFIDIIDYKIIEIIDKWNISASKVVNILEIFNKKTKSEKTKAILELVIDDIKYEYYLWEYADDISFEEDFTDKEFKWENKVKDKSYIFTSYSINKNKVVFKWWLKDIGTEEILEIFIKLIPENYRQNIIKYKAYDDPEEGSFAYVEQDYSNKSKWIMTLNLWAFFVEWKLDFKEWTHTLIHEFTHILSLGKSQIDYKNFDNCNNYLISEWCLNKNSYLNKFIEKFWKDDFVASQQEKENDFYSWKENNFVTKYAATNPWEDIAESFTYFVLKKRPKTDTIANEKILFFYNFKELVILRNNIRKALSELK